MSRKEKGNPDLLSDIGEREIIRRLISEYSSEGIIGPGDDCGAIPIDNQLLLLSTDTKTTSTHFPTGFSDSDMGWAIAAANLSDIAAMGGTPLGLLVAYGLPRDIPYSTLAGIQGGIVECLSEHSIPLIGADTKENECLTITGTSIGIIDRGEILLRKGSAPGDLVCVTGSLGGAMLGLRSLRENLGISEAEERLRRPSPRLSLGRVLAQSGFVTSCIDISDGLSSSLYELMRASGNGFEIRASDIPMHASLVGLDQPRNELIEIALHSGDEYELLFTVASEGIDALEALIEREGKNEIHVIGRTTKGAKITICDESRTQVLEDRGFEHFR